MVLNAADVDATVTLAVVSVVLIEPALELLLGNVVQTVVVVVEALVVVTVVVVVAAPTDDDAVADDAVLLLWGFSCVFCCCSRCNLVVTPVVNMSIGPMVALVLLTCEFVMFFFYY